MESSNVGVEKIACGCHNARTLERCRAGVGQTPHVAVSTPKMRQINAHSHTQLALSMNLVFEMR